MVVLPPCKSPLYSSILFNKIETNVVYWNINNKSLKNWYTCYAKFLFVYVTLLRTSELKSIPTGETAWNTLQKKINLEKQGSLLGDCVGLKC